MDEKKKYYVPHEAWVNGALKRGGSHVELAPEEAKYLLMAGTIEELKDKAKAEAEAEKPAKSKATPAFDPKTTVG